MLNILKKGLAAGKWAERVGGDFGGENLEKLEGFTIIAAKSSSSRVFLLFSLFLFSATHSNLLFMDSIEIMIVLNSIMN